MEIITKISIKNRGKRGIIKILQHPTEEPTLLMKTTEVGPQEIREFSLYNGMYYILSAE